MASIVDQTESAARLQALLDERVLNLPDHLLDLLPVGVYVCDQAGLVVRYNRVAAELWGQSPKIGDPTVRYCGSYRLYGMDGGYVPHAKCPMADVIATGQGLRDGEIMIERPDGTRIVALVNIEAIKDASGRVIGAVNVFRDRPAQRPGKFRLKGRGPNSDELLMALPAAIYTTDAAGRITFYNDAAAELWGVRPELGTSAFCGSWKLYWPDGTPLPHDECPMALSLTERRPIRGMEAIAERPDGVRVPFIPYPTPLFDASGNLIGAVNMLVDITERREAEGLLRRQADLLNQSHDAIFTWKIGGAITYWSRGAELLYGYAAEEAVGCSSHELLRTRSPIPMQEVEAQIASQGSWYGELTHAARDGRLIVVESRLVRVCYDGETYTLETNRDITARKRTEEQVRLLTREANHRTKNMLSLVQAIARQTPARAPDDDFVGRFTERIRALAANQDLLVRNEWHGVDVEDLVGAQLAHFADLLGSRIAVHGPKLPLNAAAAQAIGLALHELATNAGKYGALSTDRGRVDVYWGSDEDTFTMTWTERDGPPVSPPKRRGFGTMVIEGMAKQSVDGAVELDYARSGLTWRLTCPAGKALER